MRIVVARCSAVYTGRGDTLLNPAIRAIIIKDDGAISIHNDAGNKPINYMGVKNIFSESFVNDTLVWKFAKGPETLILYLHDVISDTLHELDLDSQGTIPLGTEKQLQEWLSENLDVIEEGLTLVKREFNTGEGNVDLFVTDRNNEYLAIEVKRTAMLGSVGQVRGYKEAIEDLPEFEGKTIRAMVAALDIRPNTEKSAIKKGIETVVIEGYLESLRRDNELAIEP